MLTTGRILAIISVTSFFTLVTRAVPFLFFSGNRKTPDIILYLGKVLPSAMMAMLIVYALRQTSITSYPYGIPELIAVVVTASLHIFKRNNLLSIFGGTAVYMLAIQVIFK